MMRRPAERWSLMPEAFTKVSLAAVDDAAREMGLATAGKRALLATPWRSSASSRGSTLGCASPFGAVSDGPGPAPFGEGPA
jgi:hypothetical protein